MSAPKGARGRKPIVAGGAKRLDVGTLLDGWGAPIDGELLILALTHRSFANTAGGPHNERLEFLGDSVLGLVAAEHFYLNYPELPEGRISRMHHATVSEPSLAQAARRLGLGDYLLLDSGADGYGGRERDSVLADAMEAMIGATYLCNGLEITKRVIHSLLGPEFEDAEERAFLLDPKTPLQEWAAAGGHTHPEYASHHEGPDHARVFHATVTIDGRVAGRGSGSSRKAAEIEAAAQACRAFGVFKAGKR
ncbi:MAG: ribonuclease III [Buchananella hordeovulneris]|nr:ribonuclease III [Buchananella hordeovulneris]